MKKNGYVIISRPTHPSADTQGRVYLHRILAEQLTGRPLLKSEVVHHIDGDKENNALDNLRVCTQTEHMVTHMEEDALQAVGNAAYRKCAYCKEYDSPDQMYKRPNKNQHWHLICAAKYKRVENPQTGPYKYG